QVYMMDATAVTLLWLFLQAMYLPPCLLRIRVPMNRFHARFAISLKALQVIRPITLTGLLNREQQNTAPVKVTQNPLTIKLWKRIYLATPKYVEAATMKRVRLGCG